jgi:hypothetical protein
VEICVSKLDEGIKWRERGERERKGREKRRNEEIILKAFMWICTYIKVQMEREK